MAEPIPARGSPPSEIGAGVGVLVHGAALVVRRPRLFLLGALPPLVMSVLLIVLLVVLSSQLDSVSTWLTPFADRWPTGLRSLVRTLLGLTLLVGSLLVAVVTFSTLTLALGSPLYDRITDLVEDELGDAPLAPKEPRSVTVPRALGQSLLLVLVSLAASVVLFLLGLVPLVGVVTPVLSAVFGGWMVALELVGSGLDRRGRGRLGQRRAALRGRRWRTLGFGVPTFLLLAVPFVSVLVFPAAAAGGTILARQLAPPATPEAPSRPEMSG